jgi:hypothetical protein
VGAQPSQNKLTVLFDRQDSANVGGLTPSVTNSGTLDRDGFVDADLADLTNVTTLADTRLDPTNASYYLKSDFGYQLNLGASVAKATADAGGSRYYPKLVAAPAVLNNVIFFSVFSPKDTVGSCQGEGNTGTYRLCNVLKPVFSSGTTSADLTKFDASADSCSGLAVTFGNIPSAPTILGPVVLQSGQGKTKDGTSGDIANAGAQAEAIPGPTPNFAFRPRSWRIIR